MGYTVDLQGADLRCRSRVDAGTAVAVIERHPAMHPYHLEVSARCLSNPHRDDSWVVEIEYFAGDHWDDEEAQRLWIALSPHLADGATLEFQAEEGGRWRIRWEGGRAFEEYITHITWAVEREPTASTLEATP